MPRGTVGIGRGWGGVGEGIAGVQIFQSFVLFKKLA